MTSELQPSVHFNILLLRYRSVVQCHVSVRETLAEVACEKLKNLFSLQEYVPIPNICILHPVFLKTFHTWVTLFSVWEQCHFSMWVLENYSLFLYNSAIKIVNVTFQICCKLSLILSNKPKPQQWSNLQQWTN